MKAYDTDSELAGRHHDIAVRHYEGFLKNPNVGDVRDVLEQMMDNEKVLVNLLQAYFTKDGLLIWKNFEKSMQDYYWEIALKEADREVENETR